LIAIEQTKTPTCFLSIGIPDLEQKKKFSKSKIVLSWNLKNMIYTFQFRLCGKFDNSFSGKPNKIFE